MAMLALLSTLIFVPSAIQPGPPAAPTDTPAGEAPRGHSSVK
jgi:hypothetical protein